MIRTVTTTYRYHKISYQGKYKCECGNKFVRTCSSGYTLNPFNNFTFTSEQQKELYQKQVKQCAEWSCPKCGLKCKDTKQTKEAKSE